MPICASASAPVQHCSCCLPLSSAAISIFQSRTCPSSVCWHSRRLISLECVMLFQSSSVYLLVRHRLWVEAALATVAVAAVCYWLSPLARTRGAAGEDVPFLVSVSQSRYLCRPLPQQSLRTAMKQVTRNVPIVFVLAPDPVGSGIVDSLSHPGGNVTGFTSNEFGLSVKWLELLKQVAPNISRVAVLRDSANSAGIGQFGAIQGAAPSFGVE